MWGWAGVIFGVISEVMFQVKGRSPENGCLVQRCSSLSECSEQWDCLIKEVGRVRIVLLGWRRIGEH